MHPRGTQRADTAQAQGPYLGKRPFPTKPDKKGKIMGKAHPTQREHQAVFSFEKPTISLFCQVDFV
jgi:hypothetical protein